MQEGGKQSLPRGLGNWGKHLETARERESVELGTKLCGTQPVLSGRWGEGPGPGVPRKVPETRGFFKWNDFKGEVFRETGCRSKCCGLD